MKAVIAVLLLAVAPAPVAAAPKHWHEDSGYSKHHRHVDDDRYAQDCYFRPTEVRIIREYYEPRYRDLPPGLAKKMRRTGQLPPGWQKKMVPVPVVVERQLAPLPPEYRRGYIDGSVLVYSPRTQVVVDVVAVFGR